MDIIHRITDDSGYVLLAKIDENTWPDHFTVFLQTSEETNLGNVLIRQFEEGLFIWFNERNLLSCVGEIEGIKVAHLLSFSPHGYVIYGSVEPQFNVLFFQEAKTEVRLTGKMEFSAQKWDLKPLP